MAFTVYDALSRPLTFSSAPRRVVSLVPSDTYNVAAIFAGAALVGRTDYCELPEDLVKTIPSVGGTKNPRVKEIIDLAPDLVIANKEENSKGDLEELLRANIRVYISFPRSVKDGFAHLAKLARIFRTERESRELIAQCYALLKTPVPRHGSNAVLRTFCPIWMKPLMTINGETFISDMLDFIGCDNVFRDRERKYPLAADQGRAGAIMATEEGRDTRYPRISEDELRAKKPELMLLPSEPHPFSEADIQHFVSLGITPRERIVHVDGKDLTWYGARAAEGAVRLRAQIAGLSRQA
jgi:ABC-type Fe3+-hydroxamate transport system substrate-binding protein